MSHTAEATLTPTGAVSDVLAEHDIEALRESIDSLDGQILAAVRRRSELVQLTGRARLRMGSTPAVHRGEMDVVSRFNDQLGADGKTLAMVLLRLGRTKSPARLHGN